jgi:phosphoenolpyruvate synthase/pyruvate phosphate dikinase
VHIPDRAPPVIRSSPAVAEVRAVLHAGNDSLTFAALGRLAVSNARSGSEHIVWLDGRAVDRDLVGGKAASLSNLVALGAPVPPAFAITTGAFAAFSAFHGLPRRVSDLVPDQLDALRQTILTGSLPGGLSAGLGDAFQRLAPDADCEVSLAVRSSATAEDSAAFS